MQHVTPQTRVPSAFRTALSLHSHEQVHACGWHAGYLGDDRAAWAQYDTVELLKARSSGGETCAVVMQMHARACVACECLKARSTAGEGARTRACACVHV